MQISGSKSNLFLICFWLSNDDVCDVAIMNSLFFLNIAWVTAETFLYSLPAFKDNNKPI